ncbi:MAG: glycosyltransferase family 39 protein [Chloroflexi bacterium]|nr:glycosyltransferase family 39 protein [Chloroflexota bacterium]
MTIILLLAFAGGAHGLNLDPIWADELASVTFMGAFDPPYSPTQVIESIQEYSPDQAPLYFILGAYWAQVVGWSQFSLRSLSLLWAVVFVAGLYRFAHDVCDKRAALFAALLMTTNSFVVLYFHDIRMYTMLMALGILHTWLYWRLAHNHHATRSVWCLFVVSTALLFYTHNFSTILFAGLGSYHVLLVGKSRRWLQIVLGWCLGTVIFAPYAPYVIAGLQFNQGVTANPLGTLAVLELFVYLLVNGASLLWLPILSIGAVALWRKRDPSVLRLVFITLIMVGLILALNWRYGIITLTRLRYFLVAWFLIAILIAFGLTTIRHWKPVAALFTILWIVAGYQFLQSGEVINYAGLMARDRQYPPLQDYVFALRGKTQRLDYLIGFTADEDNRVSRISYNSSHSTSDYYLGTQLGIDGAFLHASKKRYRLEEDVRDIMEAHPHVLLAHDPSEVPLNYARTLAIIKEAYVPCTSLVEEPALRIRKYRHPVMRCDHQPAPIDYDNGIGLIDRAALYDADAEVVQALTWWDVPNTEILDEHNISLQIITADWQNIRQIDRHFYDSIVPWNMLELSTAGLSNGSYRIVLVVYNRHTGKKIAGVDNTNGETSGFHTLLAFDV